jgi:hypothetical protein
MTMAFLPGSSATPRSTYRMAPSVPTVKNWVCHASTCASSGAIDSNGETRAFMFQRTRSAAAYSSRLSVVNCCSAPIPAPVRSMATRSPGCTCVSMNRFNVRFTL